MGKTSKKEREARLEIASNVLYQYSGTEKVNRTGFLKEYTSALKQANKKRKAKGEKEIKIPQTRTLLKDLSDMGYEISSTQKQFTFASKNNIIKSHEFLSQHITNIYIQTGTTGVYTIFPLKKTDSSDQNDFSYIKQDFEKKHTLNSDNWVHLFIRLDCNDYTEIICNIFENQNPVLDSKPKLLKEPEFKSNYDVIYTSTHRSCAEIVFEAQDFDPVLFDICTLKPKSRAKSKSKSESKSESESESKSESE